MKKTIGAIAILLVMMITALFYISHKGIPPTGRVIGKYNQKSVAIISTYRNFPPEIDGYLEFGEWVISTGLSFEGGTMSVYNDDCRLYILLDIMDDLTEDIRSPGSDGDYFWLTFDVDGDSEITAADINFQLKPATETLQYAHYTGPGTIRTCRNESYSFNGCLWL